MAIDDVTRVKIRGVELELGSESLIWRKLRLRALYISVSSGLLCNFVAVYLTFVQFILQLKLCITIVHLLLKEFKNFSQVILKSYTVITSYTTTQKQGLHGKNYGRHRRPLQHRASLWENELSIIHLIWICLARYQPISGPKTRGKQRDRTEQFDI